jgi:di/tricarboxylate transporter
VGDVTVHPGDTLLLETRDGFVERYRDDGQFLVVSKLDGPLVLQHDKAPLAGLILIAVVVGAALEPLTGVGILSCSLLGAVAMVATRCCSVDQARRSVEWPVLLSIGAALGIARVLDATGAAGAIAGAILQPTQELGPYAALICVYGVTLLLTETITNNAAAALAFPIAAATAAQLGVSVMPFAIAVALAASSGYATPIGYQTHLMVYGVGGYRFMDFVRIGVGMDLLCMLMASVVVPLAFPF